VEPAVPFALLGVVQLLSVAGWLGVAGASTFPRLRRPGTPAFVAGCLALAAADAATALLFGEASSAILALLRAGGLILVAGGLFGGAMQAPRMPAHAVALSAGSVAGVVVPLGAPVAPSVAAGVAGLAAAAAAAFAARRRDGLLGLLVAIAAATAGIAAVPAIWASHDDPAALAVLAIRALSGLAACAAVLALARMSMLARVVGAILAGVVVMAVASVGVVGNGVANKASAQQDDQLRNVAAGEADQIQQAIARQVSLVARVAAACVSQSAVQSAQCDNLLRTYAFYPRYFAAVVDRTVGPSRLAGDLSDAALQQLAAEPLVQAAAKGQTPEGGALTILPGQRPVAAVVGVAGGFRSAGAVASGPPDFVAVYGTVLDDTFLRTQAQLAAAGVTLIADGDVLASSLATGERGRVLKAAESAGVLHGQLPDAGVGIGAEGHAPAVRFVPLTAADNDDLQVATLAISEPATKALAPQRSALSQLFLPALGVLVVTGLLGLVLARRTVDPVLRLTDAARRVRRGDLSAQSGVSGRDEVGSLARAFDNMTVSLRVMTDELRDVADQEAALRARLETVVGSMNDGLVTTADDGTVTSVNPAAAQLLGADAAGAVGKPLAEVACVVGPDGARPLAVGGEPGERDVLLRRSDASTVPVRAATAPLVDARGERHGAVVLLRDMTREREVERMKTEFLSNVSHELRTPLTPIRGYAEILRKRPQLPDAKVEEYAATIVDSSTRMGRVVDLLVDVAALEAGRVQPSRHPVAVGGYVDSLLDDWRARWPEREFRRRVAARLPQVDIDEVWVGKALAELADNAVKYTTGPVTLAAGLTPSGRVRLSVRDAGPGVDPSLLPTLVGDFSQADGSATRRVGGLGLGLSFVRRLAEDFRLPFVASSSPGRGAEFGLDLPAVADVPRRRTAGRPVVRRGR
jgi:PAS domain S-box-containing protein